MRLYDICKMYSTSDDLETIIDDAIPYLFESGMTLSCWDNSVVTTDEQLTTTQITVLNSEMENLVKHLILAQNIEMSPAVDIQMWKHLLYGKWMEVKDYYERMFQIQLRKFDNIWFKDYDIYHTGESDATGSTDSTNSQQSYGNGLNGSLTGDYPNNQTLTNGFATSQGKDTSKTESHGKSVDDIDTEAHTEDSWHEYRIGAMGRSPNFVQKEAYKNVYNFVAQFAHEFDKYFRWEWEKYFENCACTW